MSRSTVSRALAVVLAALVSWALSLGSVVGASAAVAPASLSQLRAEAVFFVASGDKAQRDLAISSMAAQSPQTAALWTDFLTVWEATNRSMKMNATVPTGLPTKGHVFVVLGSALSKSGKITTKLLRRLKVAKKALDAYPKSKVLVSGGKVRGGRSEAQASRDWLIAQGVAKSRILMEPYSSSTVGNARNSMAMLTADPSITSYTLISDASHLRRSTVLFQAAALLAQERLQRTIGLKQLGNVAYIDYASSGKGPLSKSTIAYVASNVASLLQVLPAYKTLLETPPPKPVLTAILATAPTKLSYQVGEALDLTGLTVTAQYNQGIYSQVVTGAKLTGFDSSRVGPRVLTVSFTQQGVTKLATVPYTITKASSELTLKASTTKVKRKRTRVTLSLSVATAAAGVVPTGTITLTLDGRPLRVIGLAAKAKGAVQVTLPKLIKRGSRVVQAVYSGDGLLNDSSATITLRVVK